MPESVEKLEIWQEAVELVKFVYDLTKSWPKEDIYGLTSQIRRAAVSIPAILAKAAGRVSPGEMALFAQMTLVLSVEVQLSKYASRAEVMPVRDPLTMLAKRTPSFIRYERIKDESS